MKKFFHVAITSLMIFIFSSFQTQNVEILKSFINKNDFLLRSVQKNAILLSDNAHVGVVKSILKLQLISIKFYEKNKELSKKAAYQARQEGFIFLQKHTAVPFKTFEMTDKEKSFFGEQEPVYPDKQLSEAELQSVMTLDTKNPAALNKFIITLNN